MGIRRPQEEGMAFKTYIYEIKRAKGESMTSWINRSDEALYGHAEEIGNSTWCKFFIINNDPSTNSRLAACPQDEIERSGHCWSHDHDRRQSLNMKLVEKSLLGLFTNDVLQSVDRSHGEDSGNPRKQHAFEAVEEIPEDDDDTYLDDDFSEHDDPYIDEDGNFLANEQIVSDIDDDLALDDEEYHKALLGYREARDFM